MKKILFFRCLRKWEVRELSFFLKTIKDNTLNVNLKYVIFAPTTYRCATRICHRRLFARVTGTQKPCNAHQKPMLRTRTNRANGLYK